MRVIKSGSRWLVCGVVSCDTAEEAFGLLFDLDQAICDNGRLM